MRLGRVLVVVALWSGLLAHAPAVPAQELTLRVARIPFGQGFVPVTQYMLEQKLVEKAGSQLGLNLKVEWKDLPSGRPIVDGLIAGQLDLGTVGFVPTTVALAQKAPIHVLANAEGRVKFYLVVPAGSPVRQVSDLRGKTIGMIIGTDMHVFLNRMLDLELGTSDYGQLGIKLQALQTSAQLANPPKGIDASATTESSYLKALKTGAVTALANSYGTTEPNYQGPLGSGAGLELPARQKSPFFPEGVYMHRNFWLAHANLVKSQPKAVVAFLVAFEQAVRELRKWPVEEIAKLVFKFWELEPAQVKEIWGNDLNVQRGWSWLTEGDLRAVVEQSQYAKATRIITSDVDWPVVIANLRPIVPIVREAYERTGSQPGAAVFQQTNVADVRGRPVWELESWKGAR